MKNMGAILEEGGSSFDDVVKTTILLADIEDFKQVNAVYGTPPPLCSTVEAQKCDPQPSTSPESRLLGSLTQSMPYL